MGREVSSFHPALFFMKRLWLIALPLIPLWFLPAQAPVTPVGVAVGMSDGSQQVFPLGVWLTFQAGKLRAIMPTQYVDQKAVLQADSSWKYPAPGRNVQAWRNGILQRRDLHYTLDQPGARIIPVKVPGVDLITGQPTLVDWSADDLVTVAYLY